MRPSARLPIVPLTLIALLTGCGGKGAAVEPIRLLEAGDSAEIRWPGLAGETLPADLSPARIGDLARPRAIAEVEVPLGSGLKDSRVSVLAPSGSTYRFALEVPSRPVFRFALTTVPDASEERQETTFRVSVARTDQETEQVFEETLSNDGAPAWHEREIDLTPWVGEQVVIVLETISPAETTSTWGAWAVPEILSLAGATERPDVILISLDTLRADRLGAYGYHRPTSPTIDALADDGVLFETALAQAPWTRPSHRALFTGLYPASDAGLDSPALAQMLWDHGYRTGAITGGGQVDARFGFHTGFEYYRVWDWVREPELVVDWLEAGRQRADFLFLHTFEVHDPYRDQRYASDLPKGRIGDAFSVTDKFRLRKRFSDEEKAYAEALYAGGIAFTDERLGVLLDELEQRDLLQGALVIVTSDHGEAFWEHGSWRHGASMYDPELRVPLILRLPEDLRRELGTPRGAVIEQQVQLIDLYPTLLDLLGVPLDHQVQGTSLRPLLEGRSQPERWAFAENTATKTYERKSFRTAEHKFIYSYPKKRNRSDAAERFELYDLVNDPGEQRNVADEHPEIIAHYMEVLEILRRGGGELETEVPEGLDPELVEQLRALGYVGN